MRIPLLILCIIAHGRAEDKKNKQRDVNDASETVDYALNKIPLYVIQNTPPVAEAKVPVAVIPGAYSPTYFNSGIKEAKQFKYGFYTPYKPSKATPIHEPSSEETPLAYNTQHVYQKSEYDPSTAYKLPAAAKDYQTSNTQQQQQQQQQQYVKYDTVATKNLLPKHQSIPNSNAYASLAPAAYGYTGAESSLAGYVPAPKKFTTYDPENKVHIQYVIKYVPVPYTVQSADQYAQNPGADVAYATPKNLIYNKEPHKKTVVSNNQNLHSLTPVTYPTSTEAYYPEYAKYAESYAPSYDEANAQQSYYKYSQPAYYAKYVDKNAKKYVPTSYVLATIGKSAPTHYSSTIKHESASQDNLYPSKITSYASIPLAAIDKYPTQDELKYQSQVYKSAVAAATAADEANKSYSETDYSYAIASGKYKPAAALPAATHLLAYDFNIPIPEQYQQQHQYQQSLYYKKDVSASISSTPNYESSSEKLQLQH